MVLSFAYLAFSALLRLLVSGRGSEFAKEVELLVLRHQLARAQAATAAPLAAARRSRLPCRADAGPAAATPTRVDRDATDAFALASGARASQVGAAASKPRPSASRRPGARARAALRTGEPALGLPADRRRTAQARPARVAEHGQAHPACAAVLSRRRGARDRAGGSSSASRPRACSPATSSPSRRSRCAASTSCSSSSSKAAASTSPAAPPTRPAPG